MKIMQVAAEMKLEVLSPGVDTVVNDGYASDLLSDVIADAPEGCLWLTVQRHMNILAVAQLKKAAGLVITGGHAPDPQLVDKARLEGIFLATTKRNSFQAAGTLYELLKTK